MAPLLYRERLASLAYYTIQMLYVVSSFSSDDQFGTSSDDQFSLRISVHWEEKASGTTFPHASVLQIPKCSRPRGGELNRAQNHSRVLDPTLRNERLWQR